MYYVSDKKQLNSLVTDFRKRILTKSPYSTPKPQKFKELIARSLGCKSYTALISSLSIDEPLYIEDPEENEYGDSMLDNNLDYDFSEMEIHQTLTKLLKSEPYGVSIKYSEMRIFFKEALETNAGWNQQMSDELLMTSVLMATE